MSYQRVAERLAAGRTIIIDGATGTEIERRGGRLVRNAWSMVANAEAPNIVRQVHADYINAGADVLIANTFSGQRFRLASDGLADRVEELNRRGVELALEAREQAHADRDIAVAGTISPSMVWEKASDPAYLSQAVDAYREQATLLAEAGAELIALEMLSDVRHARAAIDAAVATGLPVWAGFSCKLADDGQTVVLLGGGPGETFADSLEALGPLGVDAVSIMHTEVEVVADESYTPERLLDGAIGWRAQGATMFGTCCGMGPDHIRKLAGHFAD